MMTEERAARIEAMIQAKIMANPRTEAEKAKAAYAEIVV